MDRAHEQAVQPIERRSAEPVLDACRDPILQLLGRALGKGEGNDRLRRYVGREEVGDALGDDLGLARTNRGDDLQVAAPVPHCVECGRRQLRGADGLLPGGMSVLKTELPLQHHGLAKGSVAALPGVSSDLDPAGPRLELVARR